MSSSLDRHIGRALTIALVALAAILIAGCGEGSSSTSSSTSQTGVASTQTTAAASGTHSSSTKTSGSSTSGSAVAAAAARAAEARRLAARAQASGGSSVVGGRVIRRFTGSGNTPLGTVVVGGNEVLVWRAQHPPLQIFTANRFILVNSHASAGSVRLARGTFPGMRVASAGAWTIELRTLS